MLNSHVETALIAEISKLYHYQSRHESNSAGSRREGETGSSAGDGERRTNEGIGGFTDSMVKLKVVQSQVSLPSIARLVQSVYFVSQL